MDLVRIFTKQEQVAGLSVSESKLRLVLLDHDKKGNVVIKSMVEEDLPLGAIDDGAIKDTNKFSDAVESLKEKAPFKIKYIVLTIPHYQTYSRTFYFPKIITGEKLKETMNVTVGFSLPVKVEDVYLDWEKLDTDRNELFLQTIPRTVADFYVKTLDTSGITVIALESNVLSIPRVIDLDPQPTMIISREKERFSFVIIKNRVIKFVRSVKKQFDEKGLNNEIKRISDFYEAEDEPISNIVKFNETKIVPKFSSHPNLRENSHLWLAAIGAAIRGLLPRGEDELISLLPVGTEEAHENKKDLAFTKFISDTVTAISLFFVLAYIGAWIFIGLIAGGLDAQIGELASIPLPQNAVRVETQAKEFNSLVSVINQIDKDSPRWSRPLNELRNRTTPGISIRTINITSPTNPININGVASTREALNAFRRSIEESEMFTNISLPITNLELRRDIPFSMSFSLVDQSILYPASNDEN